MATPGLGTRRGRGSVKSVNVTVRGRKRPFRTVSFDIAKNAVLLVAPRHHP